MLIQFQEDGMDKGNTAVRHVQLVIKILMGLDAKKNNFLWLKKKLLNQSVISFLTINKISHRLVRNKKKLEL